MYFIAKGKCDVLVQYKENTLPVKVRELELGDHFGEISMIYKCRRTATIRSSKYATIGYLTRSAFKQVVFKFQEIVDMFCKEIYYYDDDLKLFKEQTMRRIPYFKEITEDSLQAMIFELKTSNHEKGFMIFNEESLVNKIVIVQNGLVDIETVVDNNIFVIQSLPRGSIMNYRKFMQNTKFRIQAR
jgi:CRP-like cAMP-binding protein